MTKIGIPIPIISPSTGIMRGYKYYINQCEYEAFKNAGASIEMFFYTDNELDIRKYVSSVDGVAILGNGYDIAGVAEHKHSLPAEAKERLLFESKIIKEALIQGKPILAICGGMQVVGSLCGMKMINNIQAINGKAKSHGVGSHTRNNTTIIYNKDQNHTKTFYIDMLQDKNEHIVSCRHKQGFSIEEFNKMNNKLNNICNNNIRKKIPLNIDNVEYKDLDNMNHKRKITSNNIKNVYKPMNKNSKIAQLLELSDDKVNIESMQFIGENNELSILALQFHPERNNLTAYSDTDIKDYDVFQQKIINDFCQHVNKLKNSPIDNSNLLELIEREAYISKVRSSDEYNIDLIFNKGKNNVGIT